MTTKFSRGKGTTKFSGDARHDFMYRVIMLLQLTKPNKKNPLQEDSSLLC
jgi:hypothetical protein